MMGATPITNSADADAEPILDPGLPIVDAHHHLCDSGRRYLFDDIGADLRQGHDIVATIGVEVGDMYRADGPAEERFLGEIDFLNGMAAMSASGKYGATRLCAGIVGFADLGLGDAVKPLLEASAGIAGRRFCGVRSPIKWHASQALGFGRLAKPGTMADAGFRRGLATLAPLGLVFDAWVYFTQLGELTELAQAFPDTTIVVEHCGGPIGIGPFAGKADEVFAAWRLGLRELAALPNVFIKLGGLGMPMMGFGFNERSDRPGSAQLADAWRPYIETCIELAGADKCMFESNFPPDSDSCGYRTIWNAFKRIASGGSPSEKAALFHGTARRVYGRAELRG